MLQTHVHYKNNLNIAQLDQKRLTRHHKVHKTKSNATRIKSSSIFA